VASPFARYFRFYSKKRGERHTSSDKLGSAGLMVFFGVMAAVGVCFFAATWVLLAWPEWRVNQQFVATRCVVHHGWIQPKDKDDGGPPYRPVFEVEYSVERGTTFREWITWDITGTYFNDKDRCERIRDHVFQQYHEQGPVPCWYDRNDPHIAVLTRGYSGHVWLILLLPGAFVLLGVGGSVYYLLSWRVSAEHRKFLARKAAAMAPRDATLTVGELPGVPRDMWLTDSPGTRLAYRLPAAKTQGWTLLAMLAGCLVLCVMVSVFLTLAVRKAWGENGQWDWLLILAGLLFAAPAVWLLRNCLKQLNQVAHLGRTVVEVSDQPLQPGAKCRVFMAQFGRLGLERLRLSLVCLERATYQQGTNTRSESREVVEQEIFSGDGLAVAPDKPLEVEREFTVPSFAMHSFRAPCNEIAWMLVVDAVPRRWPAFRRTFPLVVQPVQAAREATP
jgi:hypothetical protein